MCVVLHSEIRNDVNDMTNPRIRNFSLISNFSLYLDHNLRLGNLHKLCEDIGVGGCRLLWPAPNTQSLILAKLC